MLLIDYYAYNNKLAEIHPGEKMLFFALTLTLCLTLTSAATLLVIFLLMGGMVVFLADVPWRVYLKLMLLPGSFLIVGVGALAVSITFETHNFLWATQIGSCTIGITRQGLNDAANVFLRSLASVSCLYFLTLTTPVTDIVLLLNKLRVPALVIELLTLIYRFILILLEVSRQIYLAQDLRIGYRNLRTGLTSLGKLILSVFIKSYRQSLAMYDALVSRCYAGKLHVLEDRRQWSWRNILLIFLIDGALVLSSLYAGGLA